MSVMALCLGLAACYPAPVTVQPKARFVVQDASGRPIEGATVTLSTKRLYVGEQTFAQYRTDAAGKVSLRARRTWVMQIMLPDGTTWYEWRYCIEKPGYRAMASVNPDFSKPLVTVLERSEKRSICKWPTGDQSYWAASVVEE